MKDQLTASDVATILLDHYTLSDLEFALGSTIEDFQHGLTYFVESYYDELVEMIESDDIAEWDN